MISKLNKAFESRVRLGIMSILSVNDYADFNTIKEMLDITDGNLASHLKALEKFQYLISIKQFIDRKPNTRYQITELGRKRFKDHVDALEELIS